MRLIFFYNFRPQPFKEVNENTEDNPEANESEVSSGQFKYVFKTTT